MPTFSNFCITLETNRYYSKIMCNSPAPEKRVKYIIELNDSTISNIFITVEPIMDFDLPEFVEMLKQCDATQINLGADSGNNHLPEPSKEKVLQLITELKKFTIIHNKSNLKRILG